MKAFGLAFTVVALSVGGVAMADGIDGAWKISGDVLGHAIDADCTFANATGKTSVTCVIDGKTAAATPATVAGQDVSWDLGGGQVTLTFKGKLDSDKTIKGDIEVSGVTGTFTATKQ